MLDTGGCGQRAGEAVDRIDRGAVVAVEGLDPCADEGEVKQDVPVAPGRSAGWVRIGAIISRAGRAARTIRAARTAIGGNLRLRVVAHPPRDALDAHPREHGQGAADQREEIAGVAAAGP